ncbi:heat shock 70 kDa protein 12A-like isoform X2 [Montipora capricornis]|uniref:heat shock 70 kDa protein 12A-like isoform X2 n=1 Tax=Montipora capricornis TaxID=246305 RepID=UPI0035F1B69F
MASNDAVLYSSKSSYVVVVAIDFGTTYSGYAFSFLKEKGKDSVYMNREWLNEQGTRTSKTPTCLLLKPDLSFDSFGYQAIEKYADLQDESNEQRYYFFQHFKMALHSDENVNAETTITAVNGKSVKAMTVFSHSMKYLKDEALKVIGQRTGDDQFNVNDIQWVLTVPAIWTPVAKQFMREAAYEAGLGSSKNPEQIMIALEPEAAAISCLEKNLSDFKSEAGTSSLSGILSQPNSHYMVVDIGGGTLDVTVHAIQSDGSIKELHKVTGGPYGGIKVNQEFEMLLEELFGKTNLQNYRRKHCSDWLSLMNDFEAKKRGDRILEKDVMINIRLPRSFVTLAKESGRSALERHGRGNIKLKNDEYLALSSEMMQKLFRPTLQRIKDHMKGLLQQPKLSKVKTMLLVGGFADSALLQKEMKSTYGSSRMKVLIPNHASIAVVQGAALFGKKPTTIAERVVSITYGADCTRNFIYGEHPEEKKFVADGIEKCSDIFSLFVKEDTSVRVGQKVTRTYTLLRASDTNITFYFFSSDNPDAKYTTDPGMKNLGNVMVVSPDTWKGKDREIVVSMYFGGTEITAAAYDVTSGNNAETKIDFLHR